MNRPLELLAYTTRNGKGRAGFNGAFESVVEGCQPAELGTDFAPFELLAPLSDGFAEEVKKRKPGDVAPPNPLDVFEAKLSPPQLDARLGLLKELDRLDRAADAAGAMGRLDDSASARRASSHSAARATTSAAARLSLR